MSVIDKLRTTYLLAVVADDEPEHYIAPALGERFPDALVPTLSPTVNAILATGKVDARHGRGYPSYDGSAAPGYNNVDDAIVMFLPQHFDNAAWYTMAFAHELVHWSGHRSRTGRMRPEGLYRWQNGVEEMTAQLGAAIIMEEDGLLSSEMEDYSAKYVGAYSETGYLREPPPRYIFGMELDKAARERAFDKAAQQAQDAVAYLKGLVA
jgi:antirestriction protein ArdC